jgi:hypothetical protein
MNINDNREAFWPRPQEQPVNEGVRLSSWVKAGYTIDRDFSAQRRRSPAEAARVLPRRWSEQ